MNNEEHDLFNIIQTNLTPVIILWYEEIKNTMMYPQVAFELKIKGPDSVDRFGLP